MFSFAFRNILLGTTATIVAPVVTPPSNGSLQRLALSAPLNFGVNGSVNILNATPGSTIQIIKNSLLPVTTNSGITIDSNARTLSGSATEGSILLRETFNGNVRDTLIGLPTATAPTMKVGMNLSEVNYYSENNMFIDFLKPGGWLRAPGTEDSNSMPLTLNNGLSADWGWPVQDGRTTPITYHLIMDGDCDVSVLALVSQLGAATPGTVGMPQTNLTKVGGKYTFTYSGSAVPYVIMYLNINAIRTPPTYMHMVRDDELSLYNAGEIFRPVAITDLSRFSCLRDLNMAKPVEAATNFQLRPETYGSYYITPLSILAKLAIKTGVPLWHQFNYLITDAEFLQQLPILADLKSRGLLKAVEYGNEVWNQGTFGEQYAYADQKGKEVPEFAAVNNSYLAATFWAGYRSAQLGKLARENGTQLPFAIGPQPVQPGLWYATKAGRDAVSGRQISDCPIYMTTAYCSGIINLGVTGAMGDALDNWVAQSNMDALLDNALNYSSDAPDWGQYTTSIKHMGTLLVQAKANANSDNMELVLYEGNGHFNAQPYARNIQTYKIAFVEMYKSQQMKIAARHILEVAQRAGVTLACWFDWDSQPTQFESGYFGSRFLPFYQTLVDWQANVGSGTPVVEPPTNFSPETDIPTLEEYFSAKNGVAQNSGTVASWTDKKKGVVATPQYNPPQYSATGWSSNMPAILKTEGYDHLIVSKSYINNVNDPFTFVIVFEPAVQDYCELFGSIAGGANVGIGFSGGQYVVSFNRQYTVVVASGNVPNTMRKNILVVRAEGGNSGQCSVRLNGTEVAGGPSQPFAVANSYAMGNNPSGGNSFTGKFAVFARASSYLSDAVVQSWENFEFAEWAFTADGSPTSSANSLDFSKASNSQYAPLVF